jgi:hypothetical protein
LTLAQCTNLVVNNLKDANHLLTPVVRRIRIRHEVTSTIANKNGPIPLPGRLDTEIVIHSTIGESQLISEFRAHQIVPRIGQPLFLAKINVQGDRIGGKAEDAATATAIGRSGSMTRPTR